MPKRIHSTLILVVVFVLGISVGIGGMVWAWPGLRGRLFPHHHEPVVQYLQRTLSLTAVQVPQVQAVYKETGDRSHAIHLEFVPAYSKICDEYTQVRHQERDSFATIREQEQEKLRAIFTPEQWQKFQQQFVQSQKNQPQRPPDVCRHLYGVPNSSPASPPPAH